MKKTVLILSALFVVLALLPLGRTAKAGDLPPIPLTTKSERLPGDANDDKLVNSRDTVVIVRHLAGGWGVTINADNADINGDKTVDLKDVVTLRRYMAGGWGVTLQ